jgi:glucokinase
MPSTQGIPNRGTAPFFLGIDVGGTNVKAGVVDNEGQSLSSVSVPTEAALGPDAGVENIGRAGEKALKAAGLSAADIAGVGLATPGTMDIPAGMLLDPPNLPGWSNYPIERRVAERLGLPTVLQNDANAAAYGEFWAGAARDAGSLVFWTLGTGIGCGIIVGDTIIEGAHSHGAECTMAVGVTRVSTGHSKPMPPRKGSFAVVGKHWMPDGAARWPTRPRG